MASTARIDELKKKFDENPRRYFAPLANEFRKSGDLEQAILICEEFLQEQPGHMSGHIVYGQALFETARLDDARTVFETALSLDPENLIALRHLGDIASRQGDARNARMWYERVLEADPRNDEIMALLAEGDSDAQTLATEPTTEVGSKPPALPILPPAVPAMPFAPSARLDPPALERSADPEPLDISLDDTLPAGMAAIRSDVAVDLDPPSESTDFTLEGLEPTSAAASITDAAPSADIGLVPAEFVAPRGEVAGALPLDDSLESGVPEFVAPAAQVDRLDGFEGSGFEPPAGDLLASEPLDLDDGLTLPPQGDPMPAFDAAAEPSPADDLLDFDMPESPPFSPAHASAAPVISEPAADLMTFDETAPAADAAEDAPMPTVDDEFAVVEEVDLATPDRSDDFGGVSLADVTAVEEEIPRELPPAVIAAEADLTEDVHELPGERMEDEPTVTGAPPFVTETMAELYLAQGFRDQALDVYRELLAQQPGDVQLLDRIRALEPAPVDSGPTVRDFLSGIAAWRPASSGTQATSIAADSPPEYDDFSVPEPSGRAPEGHAEEAPYSVAAAEALSEAEPIAHVAGGALLPQLPAESVAAASAFPAGNAPVGSIDALFGSRAAGTEDSAAAALSQAFGGSARGESPSLLVGQPARAAAGELSLDSVFRDGAAKPPRTSQSFSFDQFFSESARTDERPAGESMPSAAVDPQPAERTADDIAQFNSWLQGLKQR